MKVNVKHFIIIMNVFFDHTDVFTNYLYNINFIMMSFGSNFVIAILEIG